MQAGGGGASTRSLSVAHASKNWLEGTPPGACPALLLGVRLFQAVAEQGLQSRSRPRPLDLGDQRMAIGVHVLRHPVEGAIEEDCRSSAVLGGRSKRLCCQSSSGRASGASGVGRPGRGVVGS